MNICVPTTREEWEAAEEDDGPFLLVTRTKDNEPIWASVNSQGEAESFDTLDGALLWALGMIDVRTSPKNEEEARLARRLYDRHGAAISLLFDEMRRLDAESHAAEDEKL